MTKQEVVLKLIAEGTNTARAITTATNPLLLKHVGGGIPFSDYTPKRYREVDRTLQILRRNGKIEYAARRWHVVVPREAVES